MLTWKQKINKFELYRRSVRMYEWECQFLMQAVVKPALFGHHQAVFPVVRNTMHTQILTSAPIRSS